MTKLLALLTFFLAAPAFAVEAGSLYLDPHVAVGSNIAQGTYYIVGLDIGYGVTDQIAAGVGGFYSAGERPEHDTATGGGPFVSYYQPIASFLGASAREDLAYIDQRTPILHRNASGEESYTHVNEHGVASVTTLGLHLKIVPNIGLSAGYRMLFSLSNSDVGKDRSGTFFGIAIGF